MKYYYYYENGKEAYYVTFKNYKWYYSLLGQLKFQYCDFIFFRAKERKNKMERPDIYSGVIAYPISLLLSDFSRGLNNYFDFSFLPINICIILTIIMTTIIYYIVRNIMNKKIEKNIDFSKEKVGKFILNNKKRYIVSIITYWIVTIIIIGCLIGMYSTFKDDLPSALILICLLVIIILSIIYLQPKNKDLNIIESKSYRKIHNIKFL